MENDFWRTKPNQFQPFGVTNYFQFRLKTVAEHGNRYYQENAITKVLEAVANDQPRILLTSDHRSVQSGVRHSL